MVKLITRFILIAIAALGCYFAADPTMARTVLTNYIEANATTEPSDARGGVAIAKATLAMLDNESPEGIQPDLTQAKVDSARSRLDEMFFSDKPDDAGNGVLSRLKIPFLSSGKEPEFQPVDLGPGITENPFAKSK